jgi:hypothetical protein
MSSDKILLLPESLIISSPKIETADQRVRDYTSKIGRERGEEETVFVTGHLAETNRLDRGTGLRSSRCYAVSTIGLNCGPGMMIAGLSSVQILVVKSRAIPN